jgi:hypothetical protein
MQQGRFGLPGGMIDSAKFLGVGAILLLRALC